MFIKTVAFAALIAALPAAAGAAVITFNNPDTSGPYGGNGTVFTSAAEGGYTATVTSGSYIQYIGSTPTPAIASGFYNATTNATLTLTGPGLFTFDSFQAYSESGQGLTNYTISGYLAGALVYTNSGIIAPPPPGFGLASYGNQYDNVAVDTVTFATSSPYRVVLDNLAFTDAAAAVPEPATWAMMMTGFGLMGAAMRRRKVQVSLA